MTISCVVRYLILTMWKFQDEWVGDHFNIVPSRNQSTPLHEVKLDAWTTKEFKMKQLPSYMTIESYPANQDFITNHVVFMSHDFPLWQGCRLLGFSPLPIAQ
jgi:hypothetical protein